MKELIIPRAAQCDPESWEVMRAWVAENGLHIMLNIGVYDAHDVREEEAWGMILADAARHIADALVSMGRDKDVALAEIRRRFETELNDPMSEAHGGFEFPPSGESRH